MAEELNLQLGQTRAWLDRAVEEGLARVQKKKRKLYGVAVVGVLGVLEEQKKPQ